MNFAASSITKNKDRRKPFPLMKEKNPLQTEDDNRTWLILEYSPFRYIMYIITFFFESNSLALKVSSIDARLFIFIATI